MNVCGREGKREIDRALGRTQTDTAMKARRVKLLSVVSPKNKMLDFMDVGHFGCVEKRLDNNRADQISFEIMR